MKKKCDALIVFDAHPHHFVGKNAFKAKATSWGRISILYSVPKQGERPPLKRRNQRPSAPLKSPKKEAFSYWTAFKKEAMVDNENRGFLKLIRH